jgi:twinkle protein
LLIPKELIISAKEKLGDEAAIIIANDLQLKEWNEKDLKSLCYFHEEQSPSFLWSHKDFAFKCFGCSMRYGIIDHFMKFYNLSYVSAVQRLFELTDTKYSFGEKGVKTARDYKYPFYDSTEDRSIVEKYWATRKISKETLDYADIQQDSHGNTVFNYYDTNDVLSLVKYRPSRKVGKEETKIWCQKDSDTMPLLYNMNRIDFTNGPLLICEGEGDCLSAIESGYKNAVSVPFGSGNFSWIQENWAWLELFDRIIVWSDSDKPGQDMRREVCSRLGVWRTLYVEPPMRVTDSEGKEVPVKDINEILFYCGKQKVLDLINEARELPIQDIEDLSAVEDFDIESTPGLYPGLESVEKIVYKFLFKSVILVTGKRGSGKSTLINQMFICESLNQGHDCFIFSGELGSSVLKSWIELSMSGPEKIKMKNDFVHVIDQQSRKEMREWYKNRIWVYNGNSNSSDDVLDKAIATTRKYGTKVWIIDNLLTLDLGADDKNILQKQKDFIVKLNRLALLYGVLIVLVVHPRKVMTGADLGTDDIEGSGSLGNLAQYILSVHRYNKKEKEGEKNGKGGYKIGKEPIEEDCAIEVMKNRYTGKVDIARCFFNYSSYRFFNNTKELYKRYKWNKDTSPLPTKNPNDERNTPEFMRNT